MTMLRIVTVLLFIRIGVSAQEIPQAEHGVLDLRTWNFDKQKVALNGYWKYYENKLIDPLDSTKRTIEFSHFPQLWNTDVQYATYQLDVLLPDFTKNIALEIPQFYCSYRLWVNGKVIATNGKPGTQMETTSPQWLPQTVVLENSSNILTIVIQLANFHHNKGGSKDPIYLGTAPMLQYHRSVVVNSNLAEAIVLTLLGFIFFALYYIREERKKITLYFSLLCLSWAIRSIFSNNYLFLTYLPDFNWALVVRIEYITLYLTMIWSILFLSRLFPNESSKIAKYILVGLNCVFIVVTVVFSPLVFTQWLTVYLVVAGIVLFFACVVVTRALINERTGVWFLVVCLLLGILIFSYDIFVYQVFFSQYNAVFFSVGYISMFVILGIALFYHLKIFKSDGTSGMLTYDELYGKKQ